MTKSEEAEVQAILMSMSKIIAQNTSDVGSAFFMIKQLTERITDTLEVVKDISAQNEVLVQRLNKVGSVPWTH